MTNKPPILRVAVPVPLRQAFDYLADVSWLKDNLQPGMRVKVPFQHRELVAILLAVSDTTDVAPTRMKKAIAILDETPVIPADILELCLWAAEYYHHPLGEVLEAALPVLLRQGRDAVATLETYWCLTPEGTAVDKSLLKRAHRQTELLGTLLLHPEGLTERQIKLLGLSKSVLKMLHEKNWIIKKLRPSMAAVPAATNGRQAPLTLNQDQAYALQQISAAANIFQVFLLDGVTGSGKTEVYLQAIAEVLAAGQQILVLVPEIGLTPQTIQRFRQRFSASVVALHSGLSDKERLNAWLGAKSGAAKIIIGTRSAIFSPFNNLGLIVVDEEHDLSFKQHEGFRYHARDLAIMRCQALKIPIVLGSATPSLETICRAQQGRYQHLSLPKRAGGALAPQFCIVDIRNQYLEEGLSPALLSAMQAHLAADGQVMLFLNRRGFAPVLMCHNCGWMVICKRCDARMTYHHNPRRLQCHHCDARRGIPHACEKCANKEMQVIGLGTERLELALQKHFPALSIARIDRDSTQKKGSMENLLAGILSGEHKILIGTQMLAKGHHFPDVTLVGIIDPDGGFFSADFRGLERMGQLILQVAGRAGRDTKPGTVIIQTHHPEHPVLLGLVQKSYQDFAATLLQEREQAMMPPFAFLSLFRADAHQVEHAMTFLEEVKQAAQKLMKIPIWGPVAAPMPLRAGRFRAQLLIQSSERPLLQRGLKLLLPEIEKLYSKQQVRWSLDVDPVEMF
jgi:primosomal protein N' (replication factor Y)